MSQDEPKPQPPNSSNSLQAVLKAQSIKALRRTIQALEGLVVKLETSDVASEDGQATPSFLDKLQMGWNATLVKIRSFLPENLSAKLSNTALTSAIAGIAVLVAWTTSALLTGTPEVAEVPPSEPVPTVNTSTPPELTAPAAPEEQPISTNIDIPAEEEQEPISTNIDTPAEEEQEPISTNIDTPPELTAPTKPEPVEIVPLPEPSSTAEPTPNLPDSAPMPETTAKNPVTPEQNLIASIQNQVAEISDRFADGLIESIQANFPSSRLVIKLSNNWYTLEPSQQDNLAARMLEKARTLDFSELEITDLQGKPLARSPVVGTDMVILRRQDLSNQQQALSS